MKLLKGGYVTHDNIIKAYNYFKFIPEGETRHKFIVYDANDNEQTIYLDNPQDKKYFYKICFYLIYNLLILNFIKSYYNYLHMDTYFWFIDFRCI